MAIRGLLLLALATHLEARSLRQPAESNNSTEAESNVTDPLQPLAHELEHASTLAGASSADARAVSAEIYARLAAESATVSAKASTVSGMKTVTNQNTVQGAVQEEVSDLRATQQAADATKRYLEAGQGMSATFEVDAAKAGKAGVAHLNPLYKKLVDWRWQMVHDPLKEAEKAGQRAAKPFNDALQVVEKRRDAYESRAKFLSGTAQAIKGAAFGLASGALNKQSLGQGAAAGQDMLNAHHMVSQAMYYDTQAAKLIDQAKLWSLNIPAYQSAADAASHTAAHSFAAEAYAPPPISTQNFGPPPPTGAAVPM